MDRHKREICAECGRKRIIHAMRRCDACYKRFRKYGERKPESNIDTDKIDGMSLSQRLAWSLGESNPLQ